MKPTTKPAVDALDHLLIGAPSLDEGIAWLADRTGVRATLGGSHPGLGTWNALASLGPRQYVEIIAPDPAQPGISTFYVPRLREFKRPRVATWAAAATKLVPESPPELTGLSCEPPRQGSRIRTDGTRLQWRLAFPRHADHDAFDGGLPFLIEWDSSSPHPGASTPSGLRLVSLSLRHPHADVLRASLEALGVDTRVDVGEAASLEVEIDSPRGRVTLT